jgi:organic radical activating enzyme
MHRTVGIPIVVMNRDVNATSRMIAEEISVRGFNPTDHLLVHGEFLTIQGEGPFAGSPAYFVRLGGCNLGAKQEYCQGCDTSFQIARSEVVPVAALAERIVDVCRTSASRPRHVVITGGEPLLQTVALRALIDRISELSVGGVLDLDWVQFETNGVMLSSALREFDLLTPKAKDLLSFVVSPKASAKGYPSGLLASLVGSAANPDCIPVYFKFVIDAAPDSNHYSLPEVILNFAAQNPGRVYASPFTVYAKPYQGEVSSVWEDGLVDRKQTFLNYMRAAELTLQHPGIRVSVQMHTFLGVA